MNSESLRALLAKRFRHYSPDVDLAFPQTDQPGLLSVNGSAYPAILMKNDVWWFPSRSARPTMADDGRSMKTKAPKGTPRLVMIDDPTLAEIVVVEGEGDALAMRLVGYTGIAIAGGTNNLLDSSPGAAQNRKQVFAGKSVRFLFDPDESGQKGALAGARQLLEDGASRVALVALPACDDVEDWLESFESRDDALRELTQLLGGSSWETPEDLEARAKAEEKELPIVRTTSARVHVRGDTFPRLLVATYERSKQRIRLARFAPENDLAVPGYGDRTIEADVARGWSLADEHEIDGTLYIPDRTDAVREYLSFGTLVLPPPPSETVLPSVELWVEVRNFIRRWVVVPEYAPDVMTSYALLTWRLEDALFRHVPYLRFFGPPGSGKGRALDVMRQICWRSFSTQPSSQNLHRIIDFMGDITLIVDEFHIDSRRAETQQQLIDTLCYGYDRAQPVARVSIGGRGRPDEIKNFRLFGPKVFAGYGSDEHEALARRSITVEMEPDADVPLEMSPLGVPERFYEEGEHLRAQLLAWRGKMLTKGRPDPLTHRHTQELVKRAGYEVGQTYFPILSMVPDPMDEVRERILAYAGVRRVAVRQSRVTSDEAFLVESFVNAACGPEGFVRGGIFHASPQLVFDYLGDRDRTTNIATIGRRLKSLGFSSIRPREEWDPGEGRRRYYQLDPNLTHHQHILDRCGVRIPRKPLAKVLDDDSAPKGAL